MSHRRAFNTTSESYDFACGDQGARLLSDFILIALEKYLTLNTVKSSAQDTFREVLLYQ